jgi:RNA polymerase sigma factor FliA
MGPGRDLPDSSRDAVVPAQGGEGVALVTVPDRVEAVLWHKARHGASDEARAQLFEMHTPLARKLARLELSRRPLYGLELADFEQLAFEGLLEALDRFDPNRGVPFQVFARRRIRGQISDGIARSSDQAAAFRARQRALSDRTASMSSGSETGASSLDRLADLVVGLAIGVLCDKAMVEYDSQQAGAFAAARYGGDAIRELQLAVLDQAQKLDEPGRGVVMQHYLDGVPFLQIAAARNLSKGRVSQIHRAALKQLKDRLRNWGD